MGDVVRLGANRGRSRLPTPGVTVEGMGRRLDLLPTRQFPREPDLVVTVSRS